MLKIDALFNFVGLLLFFVITLIAQVHPVTEDDPQEPPGNLMVSIAWPAGPIDVDLWLLAPKDSPVGYSNKSGKVWNLLRDDLGTANDPTPINAEFAVTRGLPDGEYVVNVHCFDCGKSILPVPVTVEIRLAEGGVVWKGVVELVAPKQERTALRFRVAGGKIVPGTQSSVFKAVRRVK